MNSINVEIGTTVALSSGIVQASLRTVEFVGEQLATHTEYGHSERTGRLTDTRGTTETLYRTDDGKLIVHVENWSRWQGEEDSSHLEHLNKDDLTIGGRYEALGQAAGMGRPLTLAEALQ